MSNNTSGYTSNFSKGHRPSWLGDAPLPEDAGWLADWGTLTLGKKEFLHAEPYDLTQQDLVEIVDFVTRYRLRATVTASARRDDRALTLLFAPLEDAPHTNTPPGRAEKAAVKGALAS